MKRKGKQFIWPTSLFNCIAELNKWVFTPMRRILNHDICWINITAFCIWISRNISCIIALVYNRNLSLKLLISTLPETTYVEPYPYSTEKETTDLLTLVLSVKIRMREAGYSLIILLPVELTDCWYSKLKNTNETISQEKRTPLNRIRFGKPKINLL